MREMAVYRGGTDYEQRVPEIVSTNKSSIVMRHHSAELPPRSGIKTSFIQRQFPASQGNWLLYHVTLNRDLGGHQPIG